jgi:threonine dehydrogenase-like Zn-dependent dehydrogenase
MGKSLQFIRSVPRWLLVRNLAGRYSPISTGAFSCLACRETAPPPLPTAEWVRVQARLSGICGSDLSTIACKGSPYFSPFVSTPFVLGHELVGEIVETGKQTPGRWKEGMRVVIEPALSCEVRGVHPFCAPCARGHYAHCENIQKGVIQPGIQTGYCASTGGGWSTSTLVAHPSQLHEVPSGLSDEEAVLAEPFACAVHGALKAPREKKATLLVLGCGSIGLLVIAAYRLLGGQGRVLAAARYEHQAEMAGKLGASGCFLGRSSRALYQWALDQLGNGGGIHQPELGKPVLLGGADAVLDCVGSGQSIDDALRLTRPRGSMVLVGMPGIPKGIDWTSAWYKELSILGAYAYGWEQWPNHGHQNEKDNREPAAAASEIPGGQVKTMQLALDLLEKSAGMLKPMISGAYPLGDYRAALEDAFHTGKSRTLKTVFDLKITE